MNITSAQYQNDPISGAKDAQILATIEGVECVVPINSDNRHYAEILAQVKAGTLTIKDAE
tara:strand:+ start:1013 stop:1192 length:180 start_codon:yes stop_codon:yes gene_type:complete